MEPTQHSLRVVNNDERISTKPRFFSLTSSLHAKMNNSQFYNLLCTVRCFLRQFKWTNFSSIVGFFLNELIFKCIFDERKHAGLFHAVGSELRIFGYDLVCFCLFEVLLKKLYCCCGSFNSSIRLCCDMRLQGEFHCVCRLRILYSVRESTIRECKKRKLTKTSN